MDPLEPRIRELFCALEHAGEPAERDGAAWLRGEAGLEATGTRVRFALRAGATRLLEVRYRAYGCPHTLATCEWLARNLEGRRLDALAVGNPIDWAQHLGVPAAKMSRLLVIEDALLAALHPS
ncbi:MAG: iron-sulfur cluster assembly scaffold protein [Steroidobacteraceae bacterium]